METLSRGNRELALSIYNHGNVKKEVYPEYWNGMTKHLVSTYHIGNVTGVDDKKGISYLATHKKYREKTIHQLLALAC